MKMLRVAVFGLTLGCMPVRAPWWVVPDIRGVAASVADQLLERSLDLVGAVKSVADQLLQRGEAVEESAHDTVKGYVLWLQGIIHARLPHISSDVKHQSHGILKIHRQAPGAQNYFDEIARLIVWQYPDNSFPVNDLIKDCVEYYARARGSDQGDVDAEEWYLPNGDVISARNMLGALVRAFWGQLVKQAYIDELRAKRLPLIPRDLLTYFPEEHHEAYPCTYTPKSSRIQLQIKVELLTTPGERKVGDVAYRYGRPTDQTYVTLRMIDQKEQSNQEVYFNKPVDRIDFLNDLASRFADLELSLEFEPRQPIDIHLVCARGTTLPKDFIEKFVELEKRWPIRQFCLENMALMSEEFWQLSRLESIQHLVFNNATILPIDQQQLSLSPEAPQAFKGLKALTFLGQATLLPNIFEYFSALETVELLLDPSSRHDEFYEMCARRDLKLLRCELHAWVLDWLRQIKPCLPARLEFLVPTDAWGSESVIESCDGQGYCTTKISDDVNPVRLARYVCIRGTYYRL